MIAIERLRELEKKWRSVSRVHADELSTLIAELGQEVAAVAWIAPSSLESLNICRKDEHNGFVEVWMRPDEHRTIPLYLSPAHTSEARDAARYRWLRDTPGIQTFICGFAGHSRISGVHADVEIDAAMRQEGGTP